MKSISVSFEVSDGDMPAAIELLSSAGFNARQDVQARHASDGNVIIEAERVMKDSTLEAQAELQEVTTEVLRLGRITARKAGHSVSGSDWNPAKRWLQVVDTATLEPVGGGMKILAATDEQIDRQLDLVAEHTGIPRDRLTVKGPEGWEPGVT